MKEKFDVTGMSCSACSAHVEKSVSGVDGVKGVTVNLLTNSMQVEFDAAQTDTGKIIKAVEEAGYGASVKSEHGSSRGREQGKTQEDAVSIQQIQRHGGFLRVGQLRVGEQKIKASLSHFKPPRAA